MPPKDGKTTKPKTDDRFAMTLRMPQWKADKITNLADRLGHSVTTMVSLLMDYGLDFFDEEPLKYYTVVAANYVVLFDRSIHQQVIIEIRKDGLMCYVHLDDKCTHADFARKIPYVKDTLEKIGQSPPPR